MKEVDNLLLLIDLFVLMVLFGCYAFLPKYDDWVIIFLAIVTIILRKVFVTHKKKNI